MNEGIKWRIPGYLAFIAITSFTFVEVSPFTAEAELFSVTYDEIRTYPYRLKGRVRLLFFWVDRDDVGGGKIVVSKKRKENGGMSRYIEVIFGSKPERVPGRINRWGHGTEGSEWGEEEVNGSRRLEETLFKGFMKHSPEKDLSEVVKNEGEVQSGQLHWYKGTRSLVRSDQAVAKIRKFAAKEDFDYRRAHSIRCGYEKRVLKGADEKKELINSGKDSYLQPYGFLTGVYSVIQGIVAEVSETGSLKKKTEPLVYVYNAKLYELAIRGKKLLKKLEIPGPRGMPNEVYHSVARVNFRLRKKSIRRTRDFTLWFPIKGKLRGVPIRIVDRPRWWLNIELNYDSSAEWEHLDSFDCKDIGG